MALKMKRKMVLPLWILLLGIIYFSVAVIAISNNPIFLIIALTGWLFACFILGVMMGDYRRLLED